MHRTPPPKASDKDKPADANTPPGGNPNPGMDDRAKAEAITTARRSRGQHARRAQDAVDALEDQVHIVRHAEAIEEADVELAEHHLQEARDTLQKYSDATVRSQVAEDMSDDEATQDPHDKEVRALCRRLTTAAAILSSARRKFAQPAAAPPLGGRPIPAQHGAQHHPQGPRTLDVSSITPLAQDANYRKFREWRESWENNGRIKQLNSFSREVQVYALATAAGPHATRVLKTHLGLDLDAPGTTADVALDGLQRYYRDQRNIVVDRVAFHKRRQQQTETFDEFRFSLVDMAEDAELCNHCRDSQIVTQIIVGTRDEKARHDLLQKKDFPSLADTVELCRALEMAHKNQEKLERGRSINRVSTYKQGQRNRSQSGDRQGDKDSKCGNCGRTPKHSRDQCPAKDKECNNCKKTGHFKSVCRSSAAATENKTGGKISSVFCGRVSDQNEPFCDLDTIKAKFTGGNRPATISVLPDTGAGANLMSVGDYKKMGKNPTVLRRTQDVLTAANGLNIHCLGRDNFTVEIGDAKHKTSFIVTDEYDGTLLNRATCRALRLISDGFPAQLPKTPIHTVTAPETDLGDTKASLLKEFEDVFDGDKPLKPMNCDPVHIDLLPEAKPFQVNGPRPIPIPHRVAAKQVIDDLVTKGVITPVTKPTDWLHPATFVPKKPGSDKLRLCVDLRRLNKFVRRPHHPVRTPKDVLASLPPTARYFTTFDAKHGYFQVPLDEESQDLTTFCTPWGRFKHLRATMGLTSAGDVYNQKTDAALAGMPGTEKIVDDVLLYDDTLPEHLDHVRKFLETCRSAGITLNPGKFQLAQHSVNFAGYIVGTSGIKADPEKIKAITHFPKPTNITDLRSFLGLVEQLAGFSSEVSATMQPLRPLLRPKNEFHWAPEHDRAFEATKKVLSSPPVLTAFDPARPTVLQTDASRTRGLGYALLQQDGEGHWRLIEAGSRFITETEARYAMVELELLAVRWAMKKAHIFLTGLPHFELLVDHQPLVSILDKQTLDCIDNARLQRLKADLAPYNFTTSWKKGKEHRIPDALSRAPVSEPTPDDLDTEQELYASISAVTRSCAVAIERDDEDLTDDSLADPILEEIRKAAQNDPMYVALLQHFRNGDKTLPSQLAAYKSVANQLSEDNGLLLINQRLLIPQPMRCEVLKRLHASHQGIDRTLRRSRQTVYWPGISADVKSTVEACPECQRHLPSLPRETLQADPIPTRVFEEIGADYFEVRGKHFLALVDRLSGFPMVYKCTGSPTAASTVDALRHCFAHVGCPIRILTDGGLQFTAQETQDFLSRWGVRHRLSSAHYPQSNGLAESAVKSLKLLLLKTGGTISEMFHEGLLELRNTPRPGGKSPAEIVYGHPLRTRVPVHHKAFDEKWLKPLDEYDRKAAEIKEKAKVAYDDTAHDLKQIPVGASVRIQDTTTKLWDRIGEILSHGRHRDYRVRLPSGRCVWRNRRLLRQTSPPDRQAELKNNIKAPDVKMTAGKTKSTETAAKPAQRRSRRVRFAPDRYVAQ